MSGLIFCPKIPFEHPFKCNIYKRAFARANTRKNPEKFGIRTYHDTKQIAGATSPENSPI